MSDISVFGDFVLKWVIYKNNIYKEPVLLSLPPKDSNEYFEKK